MTRAILWDLDGVIVNSGPYHFHAYHWLLAEMDIELTEERFFSQMFGRRNRDILHNVVPDASQEEIHRLAAKKEAKFREIVRDDITPLPGAVELLRRAHDGGIKQSIVSSTPRANIELIIDTLGVRDALDAIVGEEDSERGKPDPQPFTTAADRLCVPYPECVVIEDAPEGIEAGKAAGMRCIAVTTTRPAERLTEAGADVVVDSLDDERVWEFVSGTGAYNTPNLPRITYRPFVRADLPRIRDIDRSERIRVLYIQHGTQLEERRGNFDSPNWLTEGDGDHSYAGHQAHVEEFLASGAVVLGAFDGDRLAGIVVLVQHLRPGIAQLAYLHVSNGYRASGIGKRLTEDLDQIAREGGDTEIVVSATPSQNTVRFYMGRGYQPMAKPLPELFELEPEDIHLHKQL